MEFITTLIGMLLGIYLLYRATLLVLELVSRFVRGVGDILWSEHDEAKGTVGIVVLFVWRMLLVLVVCIAFLSMIMGAP